MFGRSNRCGYIPQLEYTTLFQQMLFQQTDPANNPVLNPIPIVCQNSLPPPTTNFVPDRIHIV